MQVPDWEVEHPFLMTSAVYGLHHDILAIHVKLELHHISCLAAYLVP